MKGEKYNNKNFKNIVHVKCNCKYINLVVALRVSWMQYYQFKGKYKHYKLFNMPYD